MKGYNWIQILIACLISIAFNIISGSVVVGTLCAFVLFLFIDDFQLMNELEKANQRIQHLETKLRGIDSVGITKRGKAVLNPAPGNEKPMKATGYVEASGATSVSQGEASTTVTDVEPEHFTPTED